MTNPRTPAGNVSYLVVVWSFDGHYSSPMQRIVHGAAGIGDHTVFPSGLLFDSYGRIYAAFNHVGLAGRNSDNGAVTNYAGKALVGGYDSLNNALMFYTEQALFFGKTAAVAYSDYGLTTANLFVGGAVDSCKTTLAAQTPCWALGVSRIRPDGSAESTF